MLAFLIAAVFAVQIELGGYSLEVELAETEEKRRIGLMGRRRLPEDSGMLFVYEEPRVLTFWMKKTYIPLSIGFFDARQKLINVEEMASAPLFSTDLPTYQSLRPAKYALELPAGWFQNHDIQRGTVFEFKNSDP